MSWCGRFLSTLREHAPMRFWALVGASMLLSLISAWLIFIIAYGDWPGAQAARRLDFLGKSLWFTLFMVLVAVSAITMSKVSAKLLGGSFEIGHDEMEANGKSGVTTTTTTTTAAK